MLFIEVYSEGSSLFDHLKSLYKTFRGLRNDKVCFDLRNVNWLSPLIVLPLSAYIAETDSRYLHPISNNVSSYLTTIAFPNGINHVPSRSHQFRSYIPIGVLERENPEREKLESSFVNMVYKVLKPTVEIKNAISYPVTELVDNIFEHSKANEGYVFAQHYAQKKFVDLCIVDRGRGISASYKEEKNLEFNDGEAIEKALEGLSVKKRI